MGEGEGKKGSILSEDLVVSLCTHTQGHSAEVICVSFNTTGDLTLTGSFDNTVNIWDTATGE